MAAGHPLASRRQPDAPLPDTGCHFCGLALGKGPKQLTVGAETHSFCCGGCLHVFRIMNASAAAPGDGRQSELYRECLEAGVIAAGTPSGEAVAAATDLSQEPHATEITLRIAGMWCPSCAWVIAELLRRTPGIVAARVDFFTDLLHVGYLPHLIDGQEAIRRRIGRLGYQLHSLTDPVADAGRALLLRLGIAAILSANVMMLSFALYGGFFQELESTGQDALALALFVLTTPVIFFSGWPMLRRGLLALAARSLTMDTLIAVGALAAYAASVYQMAHHSLHLYFDTAAMLITLVLLGRFIEHRARAALDPGLGRLQELAHAKVRVLRQGRPRWVSGSALQAGERVIVEAGERIAVDGRVAWGRGDADEAILTGEAQPVTKKEGDEVLAGTLLLDGLLHLEATRLGAESSLGRILAMVHEALQSKNPLEQLADHISRWFVPLIFLIAGSSGAWLLGHGAGGGEALLRTLTVLLISCPCALGIATPLAKVAIIGRARTLGIIIANSAAFARLRTVDTLVFDKTGTVSEGSFILRAIHAPGYDADQALAVGAALEYGADHFLGRELLRQAATKGTMPPPANDCQLHPGLGVSGVVAGVRSVIGSRGLMASRGLALAAAMTQQAGQMEEQGLTVVFLGWGDGVKGFFAFGDSPRPGIKGLVNGLRGAGFDLHLLSGDSATTTAQVANQLGIVNHHGQCRPEEKVAYIRALQTAGKRVAMIGDGINDSGALALADVGVAIGANPALLMAEGADVTLMADPVTRLPEAIALSRLLVLTIRQNLAFAFLYNAIAIPLAVGGLLHPLLAVCAMFASSLTVIGNTLRLAGRTITLGDEVEAWKVGAEERSLANVQGT